MAYQNYYHPYPPMGAMPDALAQYKAPYQQPIPMQPQPMQMPSANTGDMMIFVLGEVEAQAYPVAPNNIVTMWDKNQNTIYIKSVSAQGVPSMRILDFNERTQNAPQKSAEKDFVKAEDFDALKKEFEALKKKFELASHKEEEE